MSKFVIEEQSVDCLKENYNKVIFQKQMLVAQSDKKKMETAKSMDSSKESPGIVRRRIMEMSSLLNATSSPPPNTNNLIRPLKRTSSPARQHYQGEQRTTNPPSFRIHPSYNNTSPPPPVTTMNLFFAPKPFKSMEPIFTTTATTTATTTMTFERCQSSDETNGNHFQLQQLQHQQQQQEQLLLTAVNSAATAAKQRSVSFKSCTALTDLTEYNDQDRESNCSSPPAPPIPKRSASLPRNAHKPAIPPKPRSIAMKMSPTKSEEDPSEDHWHNQSLLQQQQHQQQQQQQQQQQHRRNSQENANHKYRSEEEDKVFDTILHKSFSSPEQHRLDLLKRRQSYSEFEDLIEKKRELRERMLSKIMLLREERDFLAMEKLENDSFGQGVTCLLEHYATPQEISKYHQFLEEIEQITKLTVGLTIRLGRLTRKIEGGAKTREEMMALESKRSKLEDQTREAEFLHQNTDRRRRVIRKMLAKYLNDVELEQYDNFLVNLIKYITDLKETEQRIQLGEEQLGALNDNLNIST